MRRREISKMLRIVICTLFILIFCAEHAHAFDLDMTVDDDIRKNYNSSKLIKDTNTEYLDEGLPELPNNLKEQKSSANYSSQKNVKYTTPEKLISSGNIKIRRGTSFSVTNTTKINDWQTKGTTVKFKTNSAIYKKHYTIPAGTTFSGEIIESHQPQITCNGGLVVVRVRYMTYKGQNIPLNAYVTRANNKIIFLNNIKGERKYIKTMWKKGNWGRSLFNRMMALTINLGSEGSTIILSPFPFLYGSICLGANTLVSPITAFFSKGGHVNIPAGKQFKIKLLEDAFID